MFRPTATTASIAARVPSWARSSAGSTTESTVAPERIAAADGGGEHAGRLAPVARLVGAGDVDRLGVGARRVAGVDDADGRHVHRRTAVDDVADTGLARVDVAVVEAGHEPLLGEEDALQEQRLALELRDPAPRFISCGTRWSATA